MAVPPPHSGVVAWERPRTTQPPYASDALTVYADGTAVCPRCAERHRADQILSSMGLRPAGPMPMGWGQSEAEQARDDAPTSSDGWPAQW